MVTNKKDPNSLFYRGVLIELGSRLRSYSKKTIKNPLWLLMSIFARFLTFRHLVKLVAKFFFKEEVKNFDLNSSIFQDVNVDEVAESMKSNGLHLGINLPEPAVQEILDFCAKTNCYGDAEHQLGFIYTEKAQAEQKCGKTFNMAQYFNINSLCPIINKLAKDPVLLEIATQYLGTKPVHTGSRLWWIFPVDEASHNPNKTISFFHYDLDDYSCIRFFFYLTDVDSSSGPHVCVPGSHTNKKLAHVLSLMKRRSDREIVDYYGSENILTFGGEAGFGFAEDTFCFHKATPPKSKDRLMLQIQFAIKDYGNHNDLADPLSLQSIGDDNKRDHASV